MNTVLSGLLSNISEHYPNWDATESFMVFLFLLTSIKDAMRASALAF